MLFMRDSLHSMNMIGQWPGRAEMQGSGIDHRESYDVVEPDTYIFIHDGISCIMRDRP